MTRKKKPQPPQTDAVRSAYDRHRADAAARSAARSAAGRDIGELPAIKNRRRRQAAGKSLRVFCEKYLPQQFRLAWSPDHLAAIGKIEQATLAGGLFAVAMPRGSGKTTLIEAAILWALLFGRRKFVYLIAANESSADSLLASIKTELETNDALAEDWPEVCQPIRQLDGIVNRARGQIYQGRPTRITWSPRVVILPTMPDSPASGSILKATGLTGGFRGARHKLANGSTLRPDLVAVDDPQTDESAKSYSQSRERERLIGGAVLGLAGPTAAIAGFAALTVIRQGDAADKLLDRDDHPDWQGERFRMVYQWPTATELWDRYGELRREDLAAGTAAATKFYRANRKAMDAGAVVAWPERFSAEKGEISALQHAYNLRLRDPASFAAEFQNEPEAEDTEVAIRLEAREIAERLNKLPRGQVDATTQYVVGFVDVQLSALYWLVAAFSKRFGGHVVDYGTWPAQPGAYYRKRELGRTLAAIYPTADPNGRIVHGIKDLADQLLGREWIRTDDTVAKIDRLLVDANYKDAAVYRAARESQHAATLTPCHGRYVGAKTTPFAEWKKTAGERRGAGWRLRPAPGRRRIRQAMFDSNFFKSLVAGRLALPPEHSDALVLFGTAPATHRLLADHLVSEIPVSVSAQGRTVDEWRLVPGVVDNEYLDCLAGAAVAAAICGAEIPAADEADRPRTTRERRRIKLSELARQKSGAPA